MNGEKMSLKWFLAGAFLAVGFGTSVSAASVAGCTAPTAAKITGTSACYEISGAGNFSSSTSDQARLNSYSIGGISDWAELGRVKSGSEGGLNIISSTDYLMGTWAVDTSVYGNFLAFLLLFKAGSDNSVQNASNVAYVLSADNGSWMSPVIGNNRRPKELSHFTLYASCNTDNPECAEVSAVPVPASLPLLLGALGLGGWAARRAQRRV